MKRALKALDRKNSSKRERTTRARLAYERIANALFPGRRAAPALRYDFAAAEAAIAAAAAAAAALQRLSLDGVQCGWWETWPLL